MMDEQHSTPDEGSATSDASGKVTQRSRRPWGLLIALVVVAVAVVGLGSVLAVTTSSQANKIDSLEEEVDGLTTRLDELTGVAGAQAEQRTSLADLSRSLDNLDGRITGVEQTTDGLDGDLDSLTQCVNDYMDTVAAAGGGYYTYYRCIRFSF